MLDLSRPESLSLFFFFFLPCLALPYLLTFPFFTYRSGPEEKKKEEEEEMKRGRRKRKKQKKMERRRWRWYTWTTTAAHVPPLFFSSSFFLCFFLLPFFFPLLCAPILEWPKPVFRGGSVDYAARVPCAVPDQSSTRIGN